MFDKLKKEVIARADRKAIYLFSCVKKKKRTLIDKPIVDYGLRRCSVFDYRLKATISAPTSIFHVRFPSRRATKAKRRKGLLYAGGGASDFQPSLSRRFLFYILSPLFSCTQFSSSQFPSSVFPQRSDTSRDIIIETLSSLGIWCPVVKVLYGIDFPETEESARYVTFYRTFVIFLN